MNDPIVEEIRKHRDRYAAKFNYDLAAICEDLRERQKSCGREVVTRPAKKIQRPLHTNAETNHVATR